MIYNESQHQQHHHSKSNKPIDLLHHYLSDIVYGATDGIITSFVVVSGVEGAKLSPTIVVILGLVNLFADGISMGASNFLSIRAESQVKKLGRGFVEPLYHACATFFSFLIFGSIPLISFFIPGMTSNLFLTSAIMTGIALFFVGSLRVFITKERWFQGALEMLSIGGVAALIAYSIGSFLGDLIK